MDDAQMIDKKKLKIGLILFIIAMSTIVFGSIIVLAISFIFANIDINLGSGDSTGGGAIIQVGIIVLVAMWFAGDIILLISSVYNLSYRKNNEAPGKLSTAMLIVECIFIFPVMSFVYLHSLFVSEIVTDSEKRELKKLKISVSLLVSALLSVGIGIILLIEYADEMNYFNHMSLLIAEGQVDFEVTLIKPSIALLVSGIIVLSADYILLLISAFFNFSYRKNNEAPNKLSLAVLIMECIFLFPIVEFILVHSLLSRETATGQNKAIKKLRTSGILFLISLIGFAVGIILLPVGLSGAGGVAFTIAGGVLFSASYIIFLISGLFNLSYRKNNATPGKLSKVMFIVLCVLIFPYMIFALVASLFSGWGTATNGELKKVTITDEDGNKHILTQMGIGSLTYSDKNGDIWRTWDDGKTFEPVTRNIKITNEVGNKQTLNMTYTDFLNSYYKDEDGGEWKSEDDGQTFKKLIKEATVKDENGNEYHLTTTVPTADSGSFTDQNGDKWWTSDGGKTFTRL